MFHVILSTVIIPKKPLPLVKGAFLCKDLIRYRRQKRKACRQRRSRENAVHLEYAKKASVWMPFLLGGDKRDRTADLLTASQALSQLSYTPKVQPVCSSQPQPFESVCFWTA